MRVPISSGGSGVCQPVSTAVGRASNPIWYILPCTCKFTHSRFHARCASRLFCLEISLTGRRNTILKLLTSPDRTWNPAIWLVIGLAAALTFLAVPTLAQEAAGPVQQAEATPGGAESPGTLQQGTPGAGATPPAVPTAVTADENDISGTVAGVAETTLTINNQEGQLQPIEIEAGIPVVRDNQPSANGLLAIEAGDRVIIQRGEGDKIGRVVAYSVPPTPAPTQAATPAPTGTAAPAAPTGTPAATTVVTGAIASVDGTTVNVKADNGESRTFNTANAPGLQVFRDGNTAQVSELRNGDLVTVTAAENGVPSRIEATSSDAPPGAEGSIARFLVPLLFTLPLLALILLLLAGSRRREALFGRGSRLQRTSQ